LGTGTTRKCAVIQKCLILRLHKKTTHLIQVEIKVSGKVQGVGFRYYARSQAKNLNLKGWVRNTSDGGVLAIVQGNQQAIDTFADYLWIGPPLSEVKSVHKTEMMLIEEYAHFEIKH
jgi:acylphosphatase